MVTFFYDTFNAKMLRWYLDDDKDEHQQAKVENLFSIGKIEKVAKESFYWWIIISIHVKTKIRLYKVSFCVIVIEKCLEMWSKHKHEQTVKMVRTFAICTLVWLTTQSASHQTLPFYSVLALLYSLHVHIWSAFDLPCIRTLANLEPVHVSCMFFIVGFSLIRRFETRAFLIWGEGMLLNTEPPLQESFPIINIWIMGKMGKISRIKTEFKNDKLKKERIK